MDFFLNIIFGQEKQKASMQQMLNDEEFSKLSNRQKLIKIFKNQPNSQQQLQVHSHPLKTVNTMNKYPYQPIGWLNLIYEKQVAWGTGFLATPSIIVTIAHNVCRRKEQPNQFIQPLQIFFHYTQKNFLKGQPHRVKKWLVPDLYKQCQYELKRSYDIAFLILQNPIIPYQNFQFYNLLYLSDIPESYRYRPKIQVFGYPHQLIKQIDSSKSYIFQHKSEGQITNFIQNICFYNASTQKGMSGSAILIKIQNLYFPIGVHTTGLHEKNCGLIFHKEMFQLFNFQGNQNIKKQLQQLFKITKNLKKIKKLQNCQEFIIKNQFSDKQIIQNIKSFQNSEINQICFHNNIKDTAIDNPQIIKELVNIKTLQQLQIKYCRKINPLILKQILQCFDKNQLKYLNLSFCPKDRFPQDFLKLLVNKFPLIKQFYLDHYEKGQNLQDTYDDYWFLQNSRLNYLSVQECLFLSQNLKYLENMQIRDISDKRIPLIIRNMKSLKHLYLNDRKGNISKQLSQELLKMKSQLKTLRFRSIKITQKNDGQSLLKIIQNNPEIQTLQFNGNPPNKMIDDQFIKAIFNKLKRLKRFIILGNDNITGKYFEHLQCFFLKFFCIASCQNIDKQNLNKSIKRMKNLTHLILWSKKVDNETMQAIGNSCKMLQSLLLYQNKKVTDNGLLKLKDLKKLNTLTLPMMPNITDKGLIELTSYIKTIKRLATTNSNQQNLITIDNNCSQGITHLNLWEKRQQKTKGINLFKKFKCLKTFVTFKSQCSSNQIQQLDDYLKDKQCRVYYR